MILLQVAVGDRLLLWEDVGGKYSLEYKVLWKNECLEGFSGKVVWVIRFQRNLLSQRKGVYFVIRSFNEYVLL